MAKPDKPIGKEISPESHLRRVATASAIGTFVDWYDFFLASAAASTVWPTVYFSGLPSSIAVYVTALSFLVSYLTRPIGAFIFGHIGDKRGRKYTLILTLILMGGSQFALSATPGTASIGIAAAYLVFLWRIIFGIGVGGEYGGALTWVSEYAKSGNRGFWTSLVPMTLPLGLGVSSLAVYAASVLTGPSFVTIGWRIPFVIGGVLVIFGVIIRYITYESTVFTELVNKKMIEKTPAVTVFSKNTRQIIGLILVGLPFFGGGLITIAPYAVQYLGSIGFSPITGNLALGVASVVISPLIILTGYLADRVGRKIMMIIWNALIAIFAFPCFLLLSTKSLGLIILGFVLYWGSIQAVAGAYSASLTENFPARYRYSGSGLSYQLTGLIIGFIAGFGAPAIIDAVGGYSKAWPYLSTIIVIFAIISIISTIALIIETKDRQLEL
ncbi:hypothetical protein SUSAZ_05380 [Sulfolobus acidocaldarius SUSAZ]|nr:hypothetical protein SUSAZ_05380 [Sulfolobus acidocaldarius SUSAZ]